MPLEIWESASSDRQLLVGDSGDALPAITADFANDKSVTIRLRAPAGKTVSIAPRTYPVSSLDTSFLVCMPVRLPRGACRLTSA